MLAFKDISPVVETESVFEPRAIFYSILMTIISQNSSHFNRALALFGLLSNQSHTQAPGYWQESTMVIALNMMRDTSQG